ncbi:phosphotransferase [Sneathiella chungangensis]|uniref:Phosphotransferase n=1 Tax=Sneathiella chungangensis TaxID=1418234 RepID=A0A845MJ94_9PROT|nr:phosphotransferase [Sneathiella chungangensis]MZR23998.1 phosphotransferase [Sneathiella chungangensis]
MRERLRAGFLNDHGLGEADRRPLAGDASARRYERLSADRPLILMDTPPPENVGIFADIAEALRARGYSAPEVIAEDRENGFLLLEDLGDDIFARLIEAGAPEKELYRLAVDFLIDLAAAKPPEFLPHFSDDYVMAQNALFVDFYLAEKLGHPLEAEPRAFYDDIWRNLLPRMRAGPEVMLLRDFHSENLLYLNDRDGVKALGLLDFQDALKGPPAYDLVSLLQDARRDVTEPMAAELVYHYLDNTGIEEAAFRESYAILGAHRALRILGIFTRLAKVDGKTRYLDMIPRMQKHLAANLAHPGLAGLQNWLALTIGEGKS